MTNPWKDLEPGTLCDGDLKRLAGVGELIVENFDPRCVRQACYELRASNTFYETGEGRENKRVTADPSGYILRSNTYVTSVVMESIRLPNNVLGRILTKGQLFSVGILPVNTYADPGFDGRLGITLYNGSRRAILIKPGQAIGKIEFAVLPRAVEQAYNGQHGYQTEIWPIPVHLYATDEQLRSAGVRPRSLTEIERSYGPAVASLERRLRYYEAKVWFQIALTVVAFGGLFALYGKVSFVMSVVTGVLANLITTAAINLRGRLPQRG